MGLRSDVQSELKAAFDNELSDVVAAFTLKKTVYDGTRNVETGLNNSTETSHTSRGIFNAMPTEKINGTDVLATDEELVVIANEINTSIDVNNKIVLTNGIIYTVVRPNPVMGGGTQPIIYEAQVRKNG